jgi:hypothetical protein
VDAYLYTIDTHFQAVFHSVMRRTHALRALRMYLFGSGPLACGAAYAM